MDISKARTSLTLVSLVLLLPWTLAACGEEKRAPVETSATAEAPPQATAPAQATVQPAGDQTSPTVAPARTAVTGTPVSYRAGDTELKGYLAFDPNIEGPRPGVLVVHEWWGHNDYVRARADQLAAMGYTALAVDMYGDGKTAAHPDDAAKFSKAVNDNLEGAIARFNAAKALLEAHPTTRAGDIAAIGYCFGGGVVLHMARIGLDLDVVASFHGMLAPLTDTAVGAVKGKVLVFHGAADRFVSQEVAAAFKTEMANAEADLTFVAYPDVKHGFSNPGATALGEQFGLPLLYDEGADQASWQALEQALAGAFPR